jgi:HK97 gp10 family phage protein
MATVHIELKNEAQIMRAFKNAPTVFLKELQESILRAGVFTAGEVKQVITSGENMFKSPIDTGAMRRGVQMQQTGKLKAIITPSRLTPYALFVHEGTRFVQARPFFEITAQRHREKIQKFFHNEINAIVKGLLK